MRLSVDRADPGFRPEILPDAAGGRARERYDVTLDGEPVEHVVTADEEQGLIEVYARDEDGGFRHRDGHLLRTVLRGAVRIVRR